VAISVVTPISCIVLCVVVVLFRKRKSKTHTTATNSFYMSHVYAEAPESMPHVYVDVPEQPLEMSMMWDDDISESILETLISGKQLTIAEQIGEGQTRYSLPDLVIHT
jgi:hypothetical protein